MVMEKHEPLFSFRFFWMIEFTKLTVRANFAPDTEDFRRSESASQTPSLPGEIK